VKIEGGTLAFTGNNTKQVNGGIDVQGGTISVDSATTLSGGTAGDLNIVNGATVTNNGAVDVRRVENSGTFNTGSGSAAVTVDALDDGGGFYNKMNGMLIGSGNLNGTLINQAQSTVSPGIGSVPGQLDVFGDVRFLANSNFDFGTNSTNSGTAGMNWDLLNVISDGLIDGINDGILYLGFGSDTVGPGAEINVNVTSLAAQALSPLVTNDTYRWEFIRTNALGHILFNEVDVYAQNAVMGEWYDVSSYFNIVRDNFIGNFGHWHIVQRDDGNTNSLYLQFSPVPEPSTLAIWSLLGLGAWGWRRRRPAAKSAEPIARGDEPALPVAE